MPEGPRVRAALVREGLPEVLRLRQGPQLSALLADVGIPASVLTDECTDISLLSYARLLERVSRELSDDCIGLELARKFPIGGSGLLGFLVFNAPDLRRSIDALVKYAPLTVDALKIEMLTEENLAFLKFSLPETFPSPRRFILEFAMAAISERLKGIYGSGWRLTKAEFEYREPQDLGRYREVFGACLKFDACRNVLAFREDMLGRPALASNDLLYKTLKEVADQQLETLYRRRDGLKAVGRQDLMSRLEDYIVSKLDTEKVDVDRAAAALAMDVHELQLELRRRNTSFGHILSTIRHQRAERYLKETSLSMSEISQLLGFSELSAFTRAARGWFGTTPSSFRTGRTDPPSGEINED